MAMNTGDNNSMTDTLEQQVITYFHESIEAKMHAGEALAPMIAQASQAITHALLNENKVLTCGNGVSAANAQTFCSSLINHLDQERPGLPAITLGCDITSQTAIANDYSYNDIFARQVRALGQPGDVLLLISTSGNPSNLIQAISAAHDREMRVIALTGRNGGDIAALLDSHDIELRAGIDSKIRIHEVHLLTIFSLCQLIDEQMFGGM